MTAAARRPDVVELTERLVAAPSPNPPGDERMAAGVVTEICTELGLPTPRVLAAEPNRPNLLVDLDFGPGGRQLALSGHLDTKPVGDAVWSSDPFVGRVDDDYLYGLGACDMKGAVAAMLLAAAELAADGPTAGRLSLVFTADEEHGSAYGSRYLAESGAVRADAIVIGEPGGIDRDWDELQTISRGIANFSIDVYGDQGHSSLSDSKGFVSATQECARLLVRFADLFHPSFNSSMSGLRPTVNAGVRIEGGVGFGVVPGKASFAVDVRLLPGMDRPQLEADLDRFLDQPAPSARGCARSTGSSRRPATGSPLPRCRSTPRSSSPPEPRSRRCSVRRRRPERFQARPTRAGCRDWPAFRRCPGSAQVCWRGPTPPTSACRSADCGRLSMCTGHSPRVLRGRAS